LEDREGDMALLAQAFLDAMNREYEVEKRFAEATLQRMAMYSWPGNVRELANVVRRAHVMAPTDEIAVEHLPQQLLAIAATKPPSRASEPSVGGVGLVPGMSIAEAEQSLIEATLLHFGGDKRKATEVLGISLKTLYTRLQVYAARSEEPA
jgi:DNA-binding NtrC family response regulator